MIVQQSSLCVACRRHLICERTSWLQLTAVGSGAWAIRCRLMHLLRWAKQTAPGDSGFDCGTVSDGKSPASCALAL